MVKCLVCGGAQNLKLSKAYCESCHPSDQVLKLRGEFTLNSNKKYADYFRECYGNSRHVSRVTKCVAPVKDCPSEVSWKGHDFIFAPHRVSNAHAPVRHSTAGTDAA